ncbi:MAG: alcohol dehydrogenase [Propionibacteriaceae bacterium]|nr:alcohol dehydrogenase [Propionibacteriaceae bacterium]
MTTYLEVEDLLGLAADLGITGIGDPGLLAAAAYRPRVRLFGREVYQGIDAKAAALADSLVTLPGAADTGRLAWLAVVVFYGLNEIQLDPPAGQPERLLSEILGGNCNLAAISGALASWH